jgi:prepilin-type N-terminal cleavage/methylation domain-containing protein
MNRRGFSLVEVMIAIVILTTGVLALAASSAAGTRLIVQGGSLGRSAALAEGRIEILRSTACTSLTSGTATEGAFTVGWTVGTTGNLRAVVVTVTYPTGRGTRTDTFTSAISCAV